MKTISRATNFNLGNLLDIYEEKKNPYYGWKGLCLNALSMGYDISVHDSEEWVLSRSQDMTEIMEAIESVDGCEIDIFSSKPVKGYEVEKDEDGEDMWFVGWARIIIANYYEESVSDFTTSKAMEEIVSNPLYAKYERQLIERVPLQEDV